MHNVAQLLTGPFRGLFNQVAYGEQNPYAPLRKDSSEFNVMGSWYSQATGIDTSRVDYGRARALYRNTLPQYKLGANFARPIINYTAGFMGVPRLKHKGNVPEADDALNQFNARFVTKFLTMNRNVLRDGDCFVRLDYVTDRFSQGKRKFDVRLVHPEWVTPNWNPVDGSWDGLTISYPVYPQNRPGLTKPSYHIIETITPDAITLAAEDKAPAEIRARYNGNTVPNPWGFIPMTHFKNEPEENQAFGASDLEPLEPLFRSYHDTMLIGTQGIKLFAKPKVKFQLKDVGRFIKDNFPDWTPGKPVSFQGREIFLFLEGEDASYITADPGTAGVGTLLEYLFYCIVQTSQVPEFVLGTAVASSRASVDTQLGPFVKTIERKRLMVQDSYTEFHQMFLAMAAKAPGFDLPQLDTFDVEPAWPEITPKDEQATANTIVSLMNAFQVGTSAGLVSLEAANEFLRDFIPTLLPWLDSNGTEDERRRVLSSMAWLERVQAGGLPMPTDQVPPSNLPPTVPPPNPGQSVRIAA